MYHAKLEKELRCPLEYGLDLFGGKWKSRVICVLSAKAPLRYSALRSEMVNITDAVLAATLKELSAKGIVQRVSYDKIPPRVEYSLTEKGRLWFPSCEHLSVVGGLLQRGAGKRPGAVRQMAITAAARGNARGPPRRQSQKGFCIKEQAGRSKIAAPACFLHPDGKTPLDFPFAHQSMRLLTGLLLAAHPFPCTAPAKPLRAAQRSAQKRP